MTGRKVQSTHFFTIFDFNIQYRYHRGRLTDYGDLQTFRYYFVQKILLLQNQIAANLLTVSIRLRSESRKKSLRPDLENSMGALGIRSPIRVIIL